MLGLAQIIEGIADEFELADRRVSEVILVELGVDCAADVLLFVLVLNFCLGAEACRSLDGGHHPWLHKGSVASKENPRLRSCCQGGLE